MFWLFFSHLQYFTNYELFCKCNGIPLGVHFIYLNSGSLLGLKMAKKLPKHVALLTTKQSSGIYLNSGSLMGLKMAKK